MRRMASLPWNSLLPRTFVALDDRVGCYLIANPDARMVCFDMWSTTTAILLGANPFCTPSACRAANILLVEVYRHRDYSAGSCFGCCCCPHSRQLFSSQIVGYLPILRVVACFPGLFLLSVVILIGNSPHTPPLTLSTRSSSVSFLIL